MAIPVTCPGCSARMNAPDAAAGKKVKCPKCQKVLAVPELVVDAPAFEVVEDEPTQPVKKPAPRPAAKPQVKADVVVDENDEDEVRPAKKRARAVVEDDEDDRPRKKKKKSAAGGSSLARNIVGGVVLVILLGVVVFVFWDKFGKKEEVVSNTPPAGDPPAGPRPGPQGPGPKSPDGGRDVVANGSQKYRSISSLALSSDGKKIATSGFIDAGSDQPFASSHRVWDLAAVGPDGAREYRSPKQGADARIALSPDGNTLVGFDKGIVTFWSVATGAVVSEGTGPFSSSIPDSIAFTSDGSAAVVVADSSLVTAAVATGQITVKKPQDKPTSSAVYHPVLGRVVEVRRAAGSSEIELAMWDPMSDGAPKRVPLDTQDLVGAFAVSGDGKLLAVCSHPLTDNAKGQVRFFAVSDGKVISQLAQDDAPNFRLYRSLSLSADGRYLAGVGTGGGVGPFYSVDLFRVGDGARLYRSTAQPSEVKGAFGSNLFFAPDGKSLYYVRHDTQLTRVDTEKGAEVSFSGASGPAPKLPGGNSVPESSPGTSITPAAERKWQALTSADSLYRISFPNAPRPVTEQLEKLKVKGAIHRSTGGENVGMGLQHELYYGGHVDFPNTATPDDKKRVRDELSKVFSVYAAGGEVTRKQVKVGTRTWEEIQLLREGSLKAGTVIRTLESGGRLHILVASRSDGLPPADVQKRFFESLEFPK